MQAPPLPVGDELRASRWRRTIWIMTKIIFAVVRQHADSVLALRIVFSLCLAVVMLSGVYIFRIRKRLFDRDPEVVADHWAARNLRLWQVILVWLLAVDLLVTMLWRL
jgi:hypothetical protein